MRKAEHGPTRTDCAARSHFSLSLLSSFTLFSYTDDEDDNDIADDDGDNDDVLAFAHPCEI